MLNTLKFNLTVPSALRFSEHFLDTAHASTKTTFLTQYLMELTLQNYKFLKFLPSIIAASACYLALHMISDQKWVRALIFVFLCCLPVYHHSHTHRPTHCKSTLSTPKKSLSHVCASCMRSPKSQPPSIELSARSSLIRSSWRWRRFHLTSLLSVWWIQHGFEEPLAKKHGD